MAFVFAGTMLVTGYTIIDAARRSRRLARIVRPLEILGSRGLPGYAAMVITVLILQEFRGMPRNDLMLVAVTVVCGVAEYSSMRLASHRPRNMSQLTTGVLHVSLDGR